MPIALELRAPKSNVEREKISHTRSHRLVATADVMKASHIMATTSTSHLTASVMATPANNSETRLLRSEIVIPCTKILLTREAVPITMADEIVTPCTETLLTMEVVPTTMASESAEVRAQKTHQDTMIMADEMRALEVAQATHRRTRIHFTTGLIIVNERRALEVAQVTH